MRIALQPSEHPVERKSMSILNDLDPANTRLPSSAKQSGSRPFAWVAALLLLTAGLLWIYLGDAMIGKGTTTVPAVAMASDTPAAPPMPSTPATTAEPSTNEGGAALIRTTPSANAETEEATKQPNAFAALQEDIASGSTVAAAATVAAPAAAIASPAGTTKANQRTEAKTRSVAKATKRPASKDSGNGQRQARAGKKPAERDIDIISAIVR
jgi:hypothetical protein